MSNDKLITDNNLLCVDPVGFNSAVSAYKSAVMLLNEKIAEYEKLFDREITPEDFHSLAYVNRSALKVSFDKVVEDRLSTISSQSLKNMDRAAFNRDGSNFFNLLGFFSISIGSMGQYVRPERIRLVDGRATFDQSDADIILKESYSINLGSTEYSGLIEKFNSLKAAYDDLCNHLIQSKKVIKVNPKFEAIIRDRGLIYIDFLTKELKLDLSNLNNRNWVD